MTHSDELVERVARAIRQQYEAEYEEDPGDWWCEQLARAALSAMPGHELLRLALESLEPFAKEAGCWGREMNDEIVIYIGTRATEPSQSRITVGDLRRARATAEKLRAELGVG